MKMLKIAAKGLAGIALAALLAVNVQVGSGADLGFITPVAARANLTNTCCLNAYHVKIIGGGSGYSYQCESGGNTPCPCCDNNNEPPSPTKA